MIPATNPRKPLRKPISEPQRELFFQFIDGQWADLKGIAAMIHEQRHSELILRYLISKGLKGRAFVAWYGERFSPNPAKMFRFVLSEIAPRFTI